MTDPAAVMQELCKAKRAFAQRFIDAFGYILIAFLLEDGAPLALHVGAMLRPIKGLELDDAGFRGHFSIDGVETWFDVPWHRVTHMAVPGDMDNPHGAQSVMVGLFPAAMAAEEAKADKPKLKLV